MNRRFAALAALLCTAAAAAPASAAAPAPANAPPLGSQVPRARRNLNLISYEEVRNAHVADAMELIHNLRPSWLRTPRGATSLTNHVDVAVFKDGTRMGSRESLSLIPITVIRTVRFYSAVDARQKFGGDSSTGAIEITSR